MNIKEYIEKNISKIENEKNKITFGGHYDKIILEYVQDTENGFFVEAGANIGQNTQVLYECGWTGLLVEPSLSSYKWCLENRPNCINENCALVSFDHDKKTIYGSQGTEIGQTIHLFGFPYMTIDSKGEVPAYTFSEISKKHNIKKVDVFFLDTEGYEYEVLKGIDFEYCYIRYFVIEMNTEFYSLEELENFMKMNNFERVKILQSGIDFLFENKKQIQNAENK